MQSLFVLVAGMLALLAVVESSLEGGCSPHLVHVGDCCRMDDMRPDSEAIADVCYEKFFSDKPSTPGEIKRAMDCSHECLFSGRGMLTPEGRLNKTALLRTTDDVNSSELQTLAGAAQRKCYESYKTEGEPSQECRSGAREFLKCAKREVFLNCPGSLWKDTEECRGFREDVAECPEAYIVLPWENYK